MKVPNWFVVGSGLLALNLILVLGGVISRHASAEALTHDPSQSSTELRSDAADQEGVNSNDKNTESDAKSESSARSPVEVPTEITVDRAADVAPRLPTQPEIGNLPPVPSLDNQPAGRGLLHLDDFKQVFDSMPESSELLAPLDEMLKETPERIPKQLSQSFFDGMKSRLQTVEHLNQSMMGLVEEASILYQRGEIEKAQQLLGMATQLREMTAKLLVTRQ